MSESPLIAGNSRKRQSAAKSTNFIKGCEKKIMSEEKSFYDLSAITIFQSLDGSRPNYGLYDSRNDYKSQARVLFDPIIPHPEHWVRISDMFPQIRPIYYISTYGSIYSTHTKRRLKRDLRQDRYKTIPLAQNDGPQIDVDIKALFASFFGKEFVERFNDYRKWLPIRNISELQIK